MLIHPCDAALDDEWRTWLTDGHDFAEIVDDPTDRAAPYGRMLSGIHWLTLLSPASPRTSSTTTTTPPRTGRI